MLFYSQNVFKIVYTEVLVLAVILKQIFTHIYFFTPLAFIGIGCAEVFYAVSASGK